MKNMDKALFWYSDSLTKIGADSLAVKTQNAPEFICPICLPKPKKFWISMKKGYIGRP